MEWGWTWLQGQRRLQRSVQAKRTEPHRNPPMVRTWPAGGAGLADGRVAQAGRLAWIFVVTAAVRSPLRPGVEAARCMDPSFQGRGGDTTDSKEGGSSDLIRREISRDRTPTSGQRPTKPTATLPALVPARHPMRQSATRPSGVR